MSAYIDSHCHLNNPKIAPLGTPDALVARANAGGVAGMVTICCRIADEPETLKSICDRNRNVWMTVGTHPHEASQPAEQAFTQADIVALAQSHPKIIGIGESGLDYFYDFSDRADQAESFRKHIRACVETGLPLVVHARDADDEIIRILREEGAGEGRLKGVMHCFSSGAKMAEDALDLGFYLSFSGIVTFKNADTLRDIARRAPIERVLIETDAPYLAPEPHRKLTNEPALVVHTAAMLAGLFDMTREEIGDKTTANFFNLFDQARDTWQPAA
ncbi:MAG: TatD family hydrolase [Rhodospirillales bacterium]|nr:TatD family hydrolase [Alphaproteobacteria bacterium]MCB9987606.1 TatD family hydrolase [Rhodospirillales bacterium]USO07679.1 MAG: TatD family hydrolase [Rhodospirillales bacterium]